MCARISHRWRLRAIVTRKSPRLEDSNFEFTRRLKRVRNFRIDRNENRKISRHDLDDFLGLFSPSLAPIRDVCTFLQLPRDTSCIARTFTRKYSRLYLRLFFFCFVFFRCFYGFKKRTKKKTQQKPTTKFTVICSRTDNLLSPLYAYSIHTHVHSIRIITL